MTILTTFKCDCKCDWADEHDVYGFMTYDSREELEKVFTYMTAYWEEYPNKEVELGFGTNEYLTLNSIEGYLECFTITELADALTADAIKYIESSPEYAETIVNMINTFLIDRMGKMDEILLGDICIGIFEQIDIVSRNK